MSCDFTPLICATKPTPQASCSWAEEYKPCSWKCNISAAVVMARSYSCQNWGEYRSAAKLPSKLIGVRFQLFVEFIDQQIIGDILKIVANNPLATSVLRQFLTSFMNRNWPPSRAFAGTAFRSFL